MAGRDLTKNRMERNPTAKIWAVFLVTLATTVIGFYFNYRNFDTLKESLDQLARPGEKGDIINRILQDIIQAENHIHSYILTQDTSSRSQYQNRIAKARSDIADLKMMVHDDSAQLTRVTDLQSILELKINYLERFLKVKKLKQTSLFTSEAIQRIATEVNDTAFIDKQFIKREMIKGETIPVAKEEIIVTPDDFRGLRGLLRKLFGRERPRIDTLHFVEDTTLFNYGVEVDTSIVREYYTDSVLQAVNGILAGVMEREMKLQERISTTETRLMHQNRVFIQNIRNVIEELRHQEQLIAAARREEALMLGNESTSTLLIVGCSGILMCSLFVFLILRDVTRASHYRQQLEEQKIKAEKLARVKEDFVSNMSHEIRTPLHNISGFSYLLGETNLDETQTTFVNAIRESQRYLSELVNNILDQAKFNSGQLVIVPEAFDLRQVVNELMSVYQSVAASNGTQLRVDITEELNGVHLIGDALRIKQVLTNLLSNAVKFAKNGEVAVLVDGEKTPESFSVRIAVLDTGPGINPERLNEIFEPFVQEQPSIERTYGGTGLGLSIAQNLAKAMNGRIEAKNRENGGAAFTVFLTLPFVEAPLLSPDVSSPEGKLFVDAFVLVVEDDHWNATLLNEILRSRVRIVRVAYDAKTALEIIAKDTPDLILTDINMPHVSGADFLKTLQSHGFEKPVVAVTAHMAGEKLDELRSIGFSDACKKPFSVHDIETIIKTYLGEKASASQTDTADTQQKPDFSTIRSFAAGDETLFHRLVFELITNNKHQVRVFSEAIRAGDEERIVSLSHQMKTTYDTLRLYRISEFLESIEVYAALGNKQRVIEIATEVCPDLVSAADELELSYASMPYCRILT